MSPTTKPHRPITPVSLIDEVMGILARGEHARYADLAEAAWQPQATLAALTGSLPLGDESASQRDPA